MHVWLAALLVTPFVQDMPSITAQGPIEFLGDVWTASDQVVATWQDMRVETAMVEYNRVSHQLSATGGVSFFHADEQLTGSRLEMDTDTGVGFAFDVSGFVGPGLRVEAAEVRRLADGQYEVLNGTLILCGEDGKSILETKASRTIVDPNNSLRSFSSLLRLHRVPIFYTPYLRTSLEGEPRASGFLTPQTSTSTTKGRSISEEYYWVISRSADATVRGEYFSKRGMGGGVQFRAVPGQSSSVEINNFFAHDRLGQGGQRTQIRAYAGGNRFRTVADLNIFSSFEFRQVFEEDFNVISSPTERSVAFGTLSSPSVSYNVAYHRQGTFFRNQQTTIVRKFPSFDALVYARPLGNTGAYLSLEGGVAALHRRDAVVNSPALVGRFDVSPRLEFPLVRGPAFSWSHSVGFRETYYTRDAPLTGEAGVLNRLILDYGFNMSGPRFERQFGGWTHVVEPEVAYRYVSGVDDFPETLHVDELDLLANTHEVRYGITNRFFQNREVLSWSLSQKYYLDPSFGSALVPGRDNVFDGVLDLTGFGFADEPRRFSPIVSLVRYSPRASRSADVQLDYDTKRRQLRSAGLIGRYDLGISSVNLAYFRTRETPIQIASNQVRATVSYGNTRRIGMNGAASFSYNVDESILQAATARLSYNTECYGLHLEFALYDVGSRKESRFRFAFSLTDIGSIGTLREAGSLF